MAARPDDTDEPTEQEGQESSSSLAGAEPVGPGTLPDGADGDTREPVDPDAAPGTDPSGRSSADPGSSELGAAGTGSAGTGSADAGSGEPASADPDSADLGSAARPAADGLGDIEARFAGIVAGLRAEERPRSWTSDSTTAEVDDAHFEPPDPGPVLGGDPLLTVAWVAVLALPLALLLGVLVWNPLPSIVLQVCVVGFVLGLALLLWRMPHQRDDDDGPGAVV